MGFAPGAVVRFVSEIYRGKLWTWHDEEDYFHEDRRAAAPYTLLLRGEEILVIGSARRHVVWPDGDEYDYLVTDHLSLTHGLRLALITNVSGMSDAQIVAYLAENFVLIA